MSKNAPSHSLIFAVTYVAFFISGAASLVYEISWARQFGLLFGHTANSAAVVLFSYFLGMAAGNIIGGWISKRFPPLLAYAAAEFGVALWAAIIPELISISETSVLAAWLNNPAFVWQTAARSAFAFLLMLPATTLVGVTLPFIAAFLEPNQPMGQSRVGIAYATNTLGGVLGTAASVLWLIPSIGVSQSAYVAAAGSAGCGLIAIAMFRLLTHKQIDIVDANPTRLNERDSSKSSCSAAQRTILAAVSGFGTLGLEVLYIRLFSLVFHNSSYTFAAVVSVFIGSLALGAAIAARFRVSERLLRVIAIAMALGALLVATSLQTFSALTNFEYSGYGETFIEYLLGALALVFVVVAPPIVCLGMVLPLTWRDVENSGEAGRTVGYLTATNTAFAAFGSISISFLAIPALGLWYSFGFIAVLFQMLTAVLLWQEKRRGSSILTSVAAMAVLSAVVSNVERNEPRTTSEERLVQRWFSAYGIVDVVENPKTGSLKVRQNLHYRFGATGAQKREVRQAQIPLLIHENPKDVFVMGLGTGITAGGVLKSEGIQKVVVAELIPEVVDAARLLSEHNFNVVDDPKVEIRIDDARHTLLAESRQYDVIISDLFVPWESETGYLYTVEHYQVAKRRLKARGIFCQWIPLYQLGSRDFEIIADTFSSVFSSTSIWWANIESDQPIIALVGTGTAIQLDADRLAPKLARLEKSLTYRDEHLATVNAFEMLYFGEWTRSDIPLLNSDNNPRIEFLAPISHRNRDLLAGPRLRDYFDHSLLKLPRRSILNGSNDSGQGENAQRSRAWIRFWLFGD